VNCSRNGVAGEMLFRVHVEQVVAEAKIAV